MKREENTNNKSSQNIARAAARGVILSLLLKIFNFVLSQITLRLVDARTLGQTAIQLELLLNSCLFLSREGFRLAFVGTERILDEDDVLRNVSMNNVSWLSAPVGVLLSCVALLFHLMTIDASDSYDDLRMAGCLYCVGAMVESLSEPVLILTLQTMNLGIKVAAEGTAVFAKAVATVLLLIVMRDSY